MDKQTDQAAIEMFSSILDRTLEDVEDLPEYLDYVPTGFYKLKIIEVEKKMVEITDKETKAKVQAPVIQFVYEIVEALELADPDKSAPKAGGRFNESIFFHKDKDKALSVIKSKFGEIATAWNIPNVLVLVDQLKGAEIGATVKAKKDKLDDEKFYIQVSNAKLA